MQLTTKPFSVTQDQFLELITPEFQNLESIATTLQIEVSEAIALALISDHVGLTQMCLSTSHKCLSGDLVELVRTPFGKGFPPLGKTCSNCGGDVVTNLNVFHDFLIRRLVHE